MTINCYDNTYVIRFTDSRKGTLSIPKKALIQDQLDIALVGKNRLEYGEIFDENVLHLLENFAAPQDGTNPVLPDTSQTFAGILANPTTGQLWYNSTNKRLNVFDGLDWLPIGSNNDVAGNRGVLSHGLTIPRPVSPVTNTTFSVAECSWAVSPWQLPGEITYLDCHTDANGVITMQYKLIGDPTLRSGFVNYQIIGIKDNTNLGLNTPIPPSGTVAPTHTPTPTPSNTPTHSKTPSVTPSRSRTPAVTPTHTPTPSVSPGIEFYMYSSFNSGLGTGTLGMGMVTPSAFSSVATLNLTDQVMGSMSTDNTYLYVPLKNFGFRIYRRNGSSFVTYNTIPLISGNKAVSTVMGANPNGGKVLYTLQQQSDGKANINLWNVTTNWTALNSLGSATYAVPGFTGTSGLDQTTNFCLHNQYLIVAAPPNKIYAYYFDGSSFSQIGSYTLPVSGKHVGVVSDGSYIYVKSGYDSTLSKPPRYILTFTGSTFGQALGLANSGEPDYAVGDGYTFTGFNNETTIQSRLWDGINLGPVIATVPSAQPFDKGVFTYSTGTNRLYNPIDNNDANAKIYLWTGSTFTTLQTAFKPETDISKKLTTFQLLYLSDTGP